MLSNKVYLFFLNLELQPLFKMTTTCALTEKSVIWFESRHSVQVCTPGGAVPFKAAQLYKAVSYGSYLCVCVCVFLTS